MNDQPQGSASDPTVNKPTTTEPKFLIQVSGSSGVTPQASFQDFVEGSKEQFERIAQVVEAAGQSFVERINQIASKPTECSIEFGVNASGEAGIPFVTKGSVGANFKVTIKWATKA